MAIVKAHIHFILLLSILIQAMIPAGFMPGHAAAESYIEICGADGLMTVPMDHDGNPAPEHNVEKLCAFSLLPVADTPPVPLLTIAQPFIVGAVHFYAAEHPDAAQLAWLPPSTAPPALI